MPKSDTTQQTQFCVKIKHWNWKRLCYV